MTIINLDNVAVYPPTVGHKAALVWTRPTWSALWTLRPDLHPMQSTWAAGADLSTATLHYRYGSVRLPGASASAIYTPITARGYFVLIAWGSDDGNPQYWLGYAESPITAEHHPARGGVAAAGIQTIPCLGMLQALRQAWVTSTVHEDPDAMNTDPLRAGSGGVFNRNQVPNRSDTKKKFGDGLEGYVFTNPGTVGEWWSSRDIIEHMMAFHLPTPQQVVESGAIPWAINNPTAIPDWDRPVIDTEGQSVADIIAQLLTPGRMLNFWIGANATFVSTGNPPAINAIAVNVFTHLDSDLTLAGFGNMPANANQIEITATNDPQTDIVVTDDESDVVDQVVVRGPREIGIGTFRYDDQLVDDWSASDETKYVEKAEDATNWATMDLHEQREVSQAVRSRGALAKVFRDFRLRPDWDGEVGPEAASHPVFEPVSDGEDPPNLETYVPYLGGIEILGWLPLYSEVDYEGDVGLVDEDAGQTLMTPLVMLKNIESQVFEPVESLGNLASGFNVRMKGAIPFRVEPDVDNETGPRLMLHVHGAPQHAIAGAAFVGNFSDIDQASFGGYDYADLRATLAVRGDRRPFFQIPGETPSTDVVRRKIITIERETLQHVHIAAGTIVGVDEDGDNLTSNGGVLRDPMEELEAIATMAAEHHLSPRKRVVIETGRRLSGVQVGQLLSSVSVHGVAVNVPIVEIQVSTPIARGDDPVLPVMRITAASQRADVMALLSPLESDQEEPEE